MESEKSVAGAAFASAREADRRSAGVAAAARVVRALAQAGAGEIRLGIKDAAPLDPATLADIERVRGPAAVRIAGDTDGAAFPQSAPLSAWAIVCATGKPGDGIVSRWLNRPVSQRITWLVLHIPGARPGHATAATAVIALAMFAAMLLGGAAGLIAGGLLFQAASVVDGVDGEMARATFRASDAGAALDSGVDLATNLLFVLGLTVALTLRDGPFIAWVGGWGLALFALGAALIARTGRRRGVPLGFDLVKERVARKAGSPRAAALARAATYVTSRDFFALLFMVLILAGMERAILFIFAAATTIWIGFVAVAARDSAVQHTCLTSPENVTTV
ncbi:MAG TPA: CDP-alcohol phosphatidyltransferase family protein [Allosphingosinicella sp.]|nr:CDP-alcohol phosphatidyltransferase family protein [Allosphingosinicella sp.]